jgi:superfamily I DNA and/or RNA helicase
MDDLGYGVFDVAVIDEVSKATPVEMFMAMSSSRKTVLVGDHRQLPPMFKSWSDMTMKEASSESNHDLFSESVIEKHRHMVESSLFRELFKGASLDIRHSLFIQHRMHEDIMRVVNHFYDGKLRYADQIRDHFLNIPPVVAKNTHALWIDSTHDELGRPSAEKRHGTSRVNALEAKQIASFAKALELAARQSSVYMTGMVATFYAAQRRLVKQEMSAVAMDIDGFRHIHWKIDTVERHQGREADVVLVSMTRNPSERKRLSSKGTMAQFERINVALSRAKSLLAIFGAVTPLENYPVPMDPMSGEGETKMVNVYGNIIEDIKRMGGLFTVADFSRIIKSFISHVER